MQQCKRVHKCESACAHACSCTMCELKIKFGKEITKTEIIACNRSRVGKAGIILARIMANWKAFYTNRGLRKCVVNSLTRAVLNTSLGTVNLVRSSCEVRSRQLFSLNQPT